MFRTHSPIFNFKFNSRPDLLAAKKGDLEYFQSLRNEAEFDEIGRLCEDIDQPEPDCELTCLHLAALGGHIQICRFLVDKLNHGVDFKCITGHTPLLFAANEGHFNVVKYLVIREADVDSTDYVGNTCLHIAAVLGNREIMKLLLMNGADIEAHSVCGTPLQCAVMRGTANIDSVRFLLRHKANRNECQVDYFKFLEEKGNNAVTQKDYSVAAKCFTEALYFQPDNERLLLNRCACWANLDKPKFCLHDAEACMRLRSLRLSSHLRVGFEWMLSLNILPKHAHQFKWLLDWIQEKLTPR